MQACEKRITEKIRQHKTEVHPKVRWQRWVKLSYETRAEKATVARFNASIARRVQAKSDIMAGFLSFRWPTRFGPKRQRVSPVSFRPAWLGCVAHAFCLAGLIRLLADINNKVARSLMHCGSSGLRPA